MESKDRYEVRELTPKGMQCSIGPCLAIYEIQEVTPEVMQCGWGGCSSINESTGEYADKYLVVGKVENPALFGLEGRVGDKESLISVPKRLIDEMESK